MRFFARSDTSEKNSGIPTVAASYNVVDSINGLMLLRWSICKWDGPLTLWNPSIRRHHLVIQPNPTFHFLSMLVAFGYDATKNDYKVVMMHHPPMPGQPNTFTAIVMVYSLRNRSWMSLSCAAPCNGEPLGYARVNPSWRCACFDICREVFSYVDLPSTKGGEVLDSRYVPVRSW